MRTFSSVCSKAMQVSEQLLALLYRNVLVAVCSVHRNKPR